VTELTEEEAKRVNTEEKRVSSAFGGVSGGVANGADTALLKQIEDLKKTLEERDEEVAKYEALAKEKAGGVEQIEEMQNKLLEERETVAKLR